MDYFSRIISWCGEIKAKACTCALKLDKCPVIINHLQRTINDTQCITNIDLDHKTQYIQEIKVLERTFNLQTRDQYELLRAGLTNPSKCTLEKYHGRYWLRPNLAEESRAQLLRNM